MLAEAVSYLGRQGDRSLGGEKGGIVWSSDRCCGRSGTVEFPDVIEAAERTGAILGAAGVEAAACCGRS